MTSKGAEPDYERAVEYIDSSRMTQRLVFRKRLSVRIDGNYGVYRTTVQLGRKLAASCTCPSDVFPCKHVRAVRATWDERPRSFFDLAAFLKDLAAKPQAELVDAMCQAVLAYPEVLGVFGVPGFEPDSETLGDE